MFRRLLAHPLVRRHRARCFLYDLNDRIVPVLPGIYPSVERRWHHRARTRSGPYLEESANPFLVYDPDFTATPLPLQLPGRGAQRRRCAGRLAAMGHGPRGLFVDTSARAEQIARYGTADERREFARQYAEATTLSQFVLCPRGVGVSSRRLFETMAMGRAPVVLADDWVPPDGPAWERSCVFIPEADCERLPQTSWPSGRARRWRWAGRRAANGRNGTRRKSCSTARWRAACPSGASGGCLTRRRRGWHARPDAAALAAAPLGAADGVQPAGEGVAARRVAEKCLKVRRSKDGAANRRRSRTKASPPGAPAA